MKARFLKQLQAQKSQITLDGQRVQISSYSRVAKPRSLSRNARKTQLPEVDSTLGSHKLKYQIQRADLKWLAITKQDFK